MERSDSSEQNQMGNELSLSHDFAADDSLPEEEEVGRIVQKVNIDITSTRSTQKRKRKRTIGFYKGDCTSRTSISYQRKVRRIRTKKKLYKLRAMVPNVTAIDEASIITIATLYGRELQMRAKKLEAQIASLDDSEVDKPQQPSDQPANIKAGALDSSPRFKIITKMEVVQVGERGFYVKLVCNRGNGVAISLYKALESLESLNIESSILVTVAESFELKFTLNVGKLEVNLANLNLWVAGAFLNQGFEFKTSQ